MHLSHLTQHRSSQSLYVQVGWAAGPSALDTFMWRRLCTSFQKASVNLCKSLALCARHLACELVDPESISPLLVCHLVALDKGPGVCPIGIRESSRRIMAKAILSGVREDA